MLSNFYESLPFLGPVAEWLARAAAHAKNASKESGEQYVQYQGYFVLDDKNILVAFAIVDNAYLINKINEEKEQLYSDKFIQQLEDVKKFAARYL
jgi:hypothetical protein